MKQIDSTLRKLSITVDYVLIFCRWSFVSMMLLISSRIIFTFSDVSDSGKEVVAVVLIIFLLLILLRTVGESLRRRLAGKQPIIITPGLIDSLQDQETSYGN
jgi:hypothetical protein